MLGVVGVKKAYESGFTHSGHYYQLPIWLRWDEEGELWVLGKHPLVDALIHPVMWLEGFSEN